MTPFERIFSIMTKPWVIVLYGLFLGLTYLYLDRPLALYLHTLDLRTQLPILTWLTNVGLGAVYFIGFFLLALFFRYVKHNKRSEIRTWFLWLCVVVPSLICLMLKLLLGRARPSMLFHDQVYGFYGFHKQADFWSFPSGHTSTIMGLVFGLAILFPRYCYAFVMMGFAVAFSRVLLTNHYLSDVLFAGYLALLEVGVLFYWLRRQRVIE